ncbi:hypothetical protein BYT27DRAFT_7086406, partial [Phlegmacium glaucopus]
DDEGYDLPSQTPPQAPEPRAAHDYFPFSDEQDFQLADSLFTCQQMSTGNVDLLMHLWSSWQNEPPFSTGKHMLNQINSILLGDIPWEAFKISYSGEIPATGKKSWMKKDYEVWYHNPLDVMESQLGNPDFANEMDYAPKEVFRWRNKTQQYTDLMSGQWAWQQADEIAEGDPSTHGAMFAPVILGSDKTTISVRTSQNEYYLLYVSLGNVQNHVQRAHRNADVIFKFAL